MKLNAEKCKIISTVVQPSIPVTINDKHLEVVNSYKYLGINLNNTLNMDQQWRRVQTITNSVPYLIKHLRRVGFKTPILINVYRSHALSHFSYSAPVLTSCSEQAKQEMNSFQSRILRIINISQNEAEAKYNIQPIEQYIDTICANTLKRMLNDKDHPITAKLSVNSRANTIERRFNTNIANTEQYKQSFLQKYLRYLRDGTSNLYLPRSLSNYNTSKATNNKEIATQTVEIKPKQTCPHCKKSYKVLKLHIKLNAICRVKDETVYNI